VKSARTATQVVDIHKCVCGEPATLKCGGCGAVACDKCVHSGKSKCKQGIGCAGFGWYRLETRDSTGTGKGGDEMTEIRGDHFTCQECLVPLAFSLFQWRDLWFARCRNCGADYQLFPGSVQIVGRVPLVQVEPSIWAWPPKNSCHPCEHGVRPEDCDKCEPGTPPKPKPSGSGEREDGRA
jgi:hypothetical protein